MGKTSLVSLSVRERTLQALGGSMLRQASFPIPPTGEDRGIIRSIQNGTFLHARQANPCRQSSQARIVPFAQTQTACSIGYGNVPTFQTSVNTSPTMCGPSSPSSLSALASMHGWFRHKPTSIGEQHCIAWGLQSQRSCRNPQLMKFLHVFTDGGCLWPAQPRLRIASWAVVCRIAD